MKTLKKIGWIGTVLIILAGSVYFLFFNKATNKVFANFDKVIRETLIKKVSATGTIKPIQAVEVGTQVSGTISKLYVDFNNNVKAGQVIAQMDTRNLVASVKENEASLVRSEVQLNQSKRALDRTKELFKKGAVAKIDIEKTEDDYQLALATYKSTKLQLERNQVNLDYATIKSPIDGIVISRKVDEGQTVAASFATPTFYVIANDLKKMKIDASVDEADIGQVTKGQSVEFSVDAFPDQIFYGIVEQVQLQPVTIQNVVTYIVEITIDNKDMKLIPGMTANLEIIVTKKENVFTVPNGALAFVMNDELITQIKNEGYELKHIVSQTKKTVWIQHEKTFIEIPIETGYSNGIKTEIIGKINEGDEIVNNIEIVSGNKKQSGSFLMPQNQGDNKKVK
jgi:HlyD family secretion protein